MKLKGQPTNITGYTTEQMWLDILEWTQFSHSLASQNMHTLATKALERIRLGLPEMPPSAISGMAAFEQTYQLDMGSSSIIEEQA